MNRPSVEGQNSNRVVNLLVNHFPVDLNTKKDVFQYDLVIRNTNRDVNIRNREDCVKIKNELLKQHAGAGFHYAAIGHNWRRIIYSSRGRLGPQEQTYKVRIIKGGEGNAVEEYTVTVQYTNTMNGIILNNFLHVEDVNFGEF